MLTWFSNVRKTIVTAIGVTITILSVANVIPGPWHVAIGVVLGALTTVATYLVPNKPAATTAAAKGA